MPAGLKRQETGTEHVAIATLKFGIFLSTACVLFMRLAESLQPREDVYNLYQTKGGEQK